MHIEILSKYSMFILTNHYSFVEFYFSYIDKLTLIIGKYLSNVER